LEKAMSKDDPFTAPDRQALRWRGVPLEEAKRQLRQLNEPPTALKLDRPARVGDGIVQLSPSERKRLSKLYDSARLEGKAAKFVPASGAATRMFQALESAALGAGGGDARRFIGSLERFAFIGELGSPAELRALADHDPTSFARRVVETFSGRPKALLAFHRYGSKSRTALEEHLAEAGDYLKDRKRKVRLHITSSAEHLPEFRRLLRKARSEQEKRLGAEFELTLSAQEPSTDTIAVDAAGRPFRFERHVLLLRPGGHGALLGNLERTKGELVFVKNVDNVVPDRLKPERIDWNRALAGLLLELRKEAFEKLDALERGTSGSSKDAYEFVRDRLGLEAPTGAAELPWLLDRLDRPMRVCGVVPNTGEPGGGPFWVRSAGDARTLQIVESAELDASPEQRAIFGRSTHFNPVDLVCAMNDRRGRRYDLAKFVNPDAVFISKKSFDGRELRALERPGLWNGGMSGWNTVFVEVPGSTFHPVKTVFDLLRPAHQP
jgi:hypothetical protein